MTEPAQQTIGIDIGAREAAHVLWHFREPGGVEPGNFVAKLIDAIAAADPGNRRRLGLAFPGYAVAVELALGDGSGIRVLQAIAGVTLCGDCSGTGMVRLGTPQVDAGGTTRFLDPCGTCRGRGTL